MTFPDNANTRPGYCPDCGQPANIWNDTHGYWECSFCQWHGRHPDPVSYLAIPLPELKESA